MEHKAQNVGIAVVAVPDEREAAPKTDDVRIRAEVFGELRIEQPRRADREPRRGLRKVTREERPRLRERIVARLWGERPALWDVDAERRFALVKCVRDVRRAHVHAGELKTTELIDRAAEMQREPPARSQASIAEKEAVAFEVPAEVQSPPGLTIRLGRGPRCEDLLLVALVDGEALEDRGQVGAFG